MALTDKLTAIADAIRAKAGTSDAMTLAGMAEAIAAIEAGGGAALFDGVTSFASGTFTFEKLTSNITVEHGLGHIPTKAVVFGVPPAATSVHCRGVFAIFATGERNAYTYTRNGSSEVNTIITSRSNLEGDASEYEAYAYGANNTTINFGAKESSLGEIYSYKFWANVTFYWIVW